MEKGEQWLPEGRDGEDMRGGYGYKETTRRNVMVMSMFRILKKILLGQVYVMFQVNCEQIKLLLIGE